MWDSDGAAPASRMGGAADEGIGDS